ncbi:hypothetical protein PTKIN_Ptkin11bG0074800 [Pterospermum kingtungense]
MATIFASSSLSWPSKALSFPMLGGVTFCHVAADGRSQEDLPFVKNSPPDHSRDLIQDPRGIWSIFLKEKILSAKILAKMNPPAGNVRISPVISRSHVEMLKKWIAKKCMEVNEEDQPRLSTFVVTTFFMWVCLIKLHLSNETPDQLLRNDDASFCLFSFQAECRECLGLPTNYFGNCLRPCRVTTKRREIIGKDGIIVAAKAIGRVIQEFEKEPLIGVENWISSASKYSMNVNTM